MRSDLHERLEAVLYDLEPLPSESLAEHERTIQEIVESYDAMVQTLTRIWLEAKGLTDAEEWAEAALVSLGEEREARDGE